MSEGVQGYSLIQEFENNTDSDITRSCSGFQIFYHGILQRKYWKMTISWSFSYNSFVKLSLFNMVHKFITGSIPMDLKHSIIKGLHSM